MSLGGGFAGGKRQEGEMTRAAFEKEIRAVIVNIGLMQMRA